MCKEENSLTVSKKRRRVFLYVDGFNLYYRKLEANPSLRWLCLRTLAKEYLFPKDDVEVIKFFTAKVDPHWNGSPKQQRQLTYWAALRSTGVEIIEGLLAERDRQCRSDACGKGHKFKTMSEKMSDVNLALHVYRDFLQLKPDVICVLSADLDIVPALQMVRETKIKVLLQILLPSDDDGLFYSRIDQNHRVAMTRILSNDFVKKSLLPMQINLSGGTVLKCPEPWQPTGQKITP